jgi:excisionase family DNA binding protein
MRGPASTSIADGAGRWLSLGPASRLLGIDPDTLRRWADQGRVPAWTTPGGHRRFDRSALERLAASRHRPARHVLTSLGASPERLARVYRRHYASEPRPTDGSAQVTPDDATRKAFRHDGRRLIGILIGFLDADPRDERTRSRLEREARSIVDDQARRLAGADSSLTEAVSGFVAARQPFLAELAGLGRRRSLDPAHLAELYGDAWALLDRLLLRFIDAHQRADR